MKGHAEVAGAGFAGLGVALLLAEHGWTVRVHERSDEIDEVGAGIFLHNNGILVLEELGLMAEVEKHATLLTRQRMIDGKGRVIQNRGLTGDSRVWSIPRFILIKILLDAAQARGAEIVTGSTISAAKPEGVLVDSHGTEHRADLVVGADGHHSRVRQSLGLTDVQTELATTSLRFILEDRLLAEAPMTTEYWSRRRRIALAACGPSHTYVYLACPAADTLGSAAPIDIGSWSAHFPRLAGVFERLHREDVHRSQYSLVTCPRWGSGSAVILGDAAHALAPTLGQGANLALSNSRSLVTFLNAEPDVGRAVIRWEAAVRGVTDNTQRWSEYYNRATKHWPPWLSLGRAAVIWSFGASDYLNARLRLADRTGPVLDAGS